MTFKIGDRVSPKREYIYSFSQNRTLFHEVGTIVDMRDSEMTVLVKCDRGGIGTWRVHQIELAVNGVEIMMRLLE